MLDAALTGSVLLIGGSDSCGGAGIQADLKTLTVLGAYGSCCITALTAQNTTGIRSVRAMDKEFVTDQCEAVCEDFRIDVIKTGMLLNEDIVNSVCDFIEKQSAYVVVDPVMVSTSGCALLSKESVHALKSRLLPRALIITPNIPEALALSGIQKIKSIEDMVAAGEQLSTFGCQYVLLKGGHLDGEGDQSIDVLVWKEGEVCLHEVIRGVHVSTKNAHGTGCTLASAISALVSDFVSKEQQGVPTIPPSLMATFVKEAKRYLEGCLTNSFGIHESGVLLSRPSSLNNACRPGNLNHFWQRAKG
eukprot:Nk52_evm5s370 gene=Nk52_evmTU5s370